MSKFKPLLAEKYEPDQVKYPVMATPKLDGIRCCILNGEAVSRKLKPIPNHFIREQLKGLPDGLDGELMLTEGDFNNVQSGVMSEDGEPNFLFYVFDDFSDPNLPYEQRVAKYERINHPRVAFVQTVVICNEMELETYTDACLKLGFEGAMIRHIQGRYKYGRSTVKEGILLKVKRFHDDEGIVTNIFEAMHNENVAELDERGYTKRSSHKENMVPAGKAGAIEVSWKGHTFKVGFGEGFTDEVKKEIWESRDKYIGKHLTFKYQELSSDGIPRFGKAVSFRHSGDMD